MGMVKGLIKSAVAIKVAQVAQRELSKPENQRKIKEGFQKVQEQGQAPLTAYAEQGTVGPRC